MERMRSIVFKLIPAVALLAILLGLMQLAGRQGDPRGGSQSLSFKSPAGDLAARRVINIGGFSGVVLPNGRFITPVGTELSTRAPKPYGMALSPDGNTLATVNSGTTPFSITLFKNIRSGNPSIFLIPVSSTFMGIAFSP